MYLLLRIWFFINISFVRTSDNIIIKHTQSLFSEVKKATKIWIYLFIINKINFFSSDFLKLKILSFLIIHSNFQNNYDKCTEIEVLNNNKFSEMLTFFLFSWLNSNQISLKLKSEKMILMSFFVTEFSSEIFLQYWRFESNKRLNTVDLII